MDKVLILGATDYKMMEVVRSLAKKDVEVHITCDSKSCPAYFSKYPKKKFVIKNDVNTKILDLIKKEKYFLILPSGEAIDIARDKRLKKFCFLSNSKSIEIAADKEKTMKLAKELGIKIPRTTYVKNLRDLKKISQKIKYPVILKPSSLKKSGKRPMYIFLKEDFIDSYLEYHKESAYPIIQEVIKGEGAGVFVICSKGKPLQYFAHKRVLEQDPYGAGSAVCESSDVSRKIKKDVEKICHRLKWEGLMMLEYKIEKETREFYLIEINPRFWGSIPLARMSGVNFPYLLYLLKKDRKIKPRKWKKTRAKYTVGMLKYFSRILKGKKRDWQFYFPTKGEAVGKIIKLWIKSGRDFLWDWKDPLPFFIDLYKNIKKTK